jgi:hypothetical protein
MELLLNYLDKQEKFCHSIGMTNIDTNALQERIVQTLPMLNECKWRRFIAIDSKSLRYGGIILINRISGMSRRTPSEGVKELDDPNAEEITPKSRIRKAGAGRKPVWEEHPVMLESLEDLVSTHTKNLSINNFYTLSFMWLYIVIPFAMKGFSE